MNPGLFRGLEIFCAVVEAGSATAAARRLGVSQPAISQQIARLEAELSLSLFVRQNGRMRPTETALRIYEESRTAFDGLGRVLNLARDIHALDSGELRIAAPHSMSGHFLPRVLARLTEGRPQLRLRLHLGNYEAIVRRVASREADLGVAKLPFMVPGVEGVEIAASPLVAVSASASSPAAAGPEPARRLSLAQLARQPLIMVGRGRPWRDEIDLAFRRAGLAAQVRVETKSVVSACGMAAAGFGIAILPQWLVWGLRRRDLRMQPVELDILHRFVAVHPSGVHRSDLARDFARLCAEVAAELSDGGSG